MFQNLFDDFREFLLQGKATDLAIGTLLGVATTPLVESIVKDVAMPPIGLFLGKADLPSQFLVLRDGEAGGPYKSIKQAAADGATTLNYGRFLNKSLTFVLLIGVAFSIVQGINYLRKMEKEQEQKIKKKAIKDLILKES